MNTSAKLGLLGSLYFCQGLPFGFFTQALPVVLRKQGLTLTEIGLTSLLAAPWALKFLWAPAVDRHSSPKFGRRRSWIVPLQLGATAVLIALAMGAGAGALPVLLGIVFLLNLLAATQDIATDGLAVDLLAPGERGLGNGVQVAGYRVGMILGGGVLLIVHDELGSSGTFLAMAAAIALATLPLFFLHEASAVAPARAERTTLHFLRRPGSLGLLALIMAYKAGDAFGGSMLRPLLVDYGFGLGDIGWLLGTVGFVAGLFGALAGGALVNRLGRRPALVTFGVLQSLAVASYALLTFGRPATPLLYSLCAVEHFTGGMATAALFTCMMDWSSRESAATDYTVQASAVVIASGAASALGGYSADVLGYFAHFCLGGVLSLAALLLVQRSHPREVLLCA
jgi:MFS transporter, PAT family, beta-lactamase induction signal transducer AmpG